MNWYNLSRDIKIEIYLYLINDDIQTIEQAIYILLNYIINKESIILLKQIYKRLKQIKPTVKKYNELFFYHKNDYNDKINKCITYNQIFHTINQDVTIYDYEIEPIQFKVVYLNFDFLEYKNNFYSPSKLEIYNKLNKVIWNCSYILVELPIFYRNFTDIIFTQRLFYKKDATWTVMNLLESIFNFYQEKLSREQAIYLDNKYFSGFQDINEENIETFAGNSIYCYVDYVWIEGIKKKFFIKKNNKYTIFYPTLF